MLDDDDGMSAPAAKRAGPPDVDPVLLGGIRFEAVHWGHERGLGQNGGYIATFDVGSERELWTLKIYDATYDPEMEEDVQDVFIESISARDASTLVVLDERGRSYLVDINSRQVRTLAVDGSDWQ